MAKLTSHFFKKRPKQAASADAPLYHLDHGRPMSRREFIAQGFVRGSHGYGAL